MKIVAIMSQDNTVKNIIVLPEDRIADFENAVLELGITDTPILCDTNSYRGKNRDGSPGIAFRKNYPSIGFIYDKATDSFLEPKPTGNPSWVFDSDGGFWKPPVSRPRDGKKYYWNESIVNWSLVESNA